MYKIIGADKKEYGPVSADQLHRWLSEGRVNAQTLMQAAGTTDWKPLSAFPEFADSLRVHTESPPPLPANVPMSEEAWKSEILARDPQIKIGYCLSRAWTLLTENFFLFFSSVLLVWGIGTVCQINIIPKLIFWALQGPLYGGLYLVFLKRVRGEPASVSDTFSGFRLSFSQLLLTGCITSFLSFIGLIFCVLPGIYLLIVWRFALPLIADRGMEFWSAMEMSRKTLTRVWFPMFALVLLAFLPSLVFTFTLMIKTMYPIYAFFNEALSHGNLTQEQIQALSPQMQALLTQTIEANQTLFWVAKIVQLVTMPFAYAALMCGYENLFGSRKT